MKADPARQWRLLDLQGLDTRRQQIAHRRRRLPQSATHDELAARLEDLRARLVTARTAHGDVQREVAKAEADVQLVRDRAARDRARLDSGQGGAKELQALEHELQSLARRQSDLEDVELEVMERAETLEEEVGRLEAEHAGLAQEVAAAAEARDAALRELDDEDERIGRERGDVSAGVGDDLLGLYEKIREQTGMGAAALRQRRCEGCRLELLGADLRRVAEAPEDEVVRCEECRRILVRTAESGL